MNPMPESTIRTYPKPSPLVRVDRAPSSPVSLPWKLATSAPDGRSITIVYVRGFDGCVDADGVEIDEGQAAVTVTVWGKDLGAFACGGGPLLTSTVVELTAPLARRPLVHAPITPAFAADYFAR